MDQPKNGGRVGFYLQMANEPKATLELIRSVRVHFPDAPLSVTSDAGSYDCSAACETYGCVFTREDTTAGMHGGGGVMEYVPRLKRAVESAETEWIVLLEDDVRVERGARGGQEVSTEESRTRGGLRPCRRSYSRRLRGAPGEGAEPRITLVRRRPSAGRPAKSLPDDLPEEKTRPQQKTHRFGGGTTSP